MDEPAESVSLLIVDDHPLFRQGVRLFLESQPGITVAGEAGDGASAIAFLEKNPVGCVLLDLQMPGKSGIDVAKDIKDRWPDTHPGPHRVQHWDMILPRLKAGASLHLRRSPPNCLPH